MGSFENYDRILSYLSTVLHYINQVPTAQYLRSHLPRMGNCESWCIRIGANN